ncbi:MULTISPECIES: NADPH-dependent F420 reductase [Bradyrhizobium]|uniref:F420-dependent NADP reductase n=1 Tax=Bradyrhizobium retamae TaxID=1300035 RepID=A0A0R3MN05_9BRAD|nr:MULTISPECIES: NADPH-dependent F420 reductase [Bradyrhizobium]KRR20974.1 F420-dependent NADP reductase [Bradyrhizobium retamae]WOH52796.1 NADPH-dependent F420 reductase [Bradyrhizobium sp. sBnM-33]
MSNANLPILSIVGGTGDLGSGLARSWSRAGYSVILGSRSIERAQEAVSLLKSEGFANVSGDTNAAAAAKSDIVVVAVPFSNYEASLGEIKDPAKSKIVVTAVVPLVPPKVSVVHLPSAGSAALIAQSLLDPSSRVVGAFHNVGSQKLHAGGKADCDVLVFSDDADARNQVITLADAVSNRGVDGGVLANSTAAEALTSVLIAINRKYKVKGAGISISGLT